MRPVRRITAEEENFRTERRWCFEVMKRDPVEPEPVGSIVLMAFRVTGYDPDCDGSLMARLEHIDKEGTPTGWDTTNVGLYPDTDLTCSIEEFAAMFTQEAPDEDS